jgi:hypothetical protein
LTKIFGVCAALFAADTKDRRFADPAWKESLAYRSLA